MSKIVANQLSPQSGDIITINGGISVGGTVTYEDVTNVDSVGLITARSGLIVQGSGIGLSVTEGGARVTGIVTATSFAGNIAGDVTGDLTGNVTGNLTGNVTGNTSGTAGGLTGTPNISITNLNTEGHLKEKVNITAGKLSDNTDINLDDGMVHFFTTTETTTATPNIVSSTGINTSMATGDVVSVNIITTAAAAGYASSITIDGSGEILRWNGGDAPSEGGASGNDFYTYSIIKTGDAAFTVLANVSNFAY